MEFKFRNSESLEEIKKIIQNSQPKQTILWQNSSQGRKVFNCNLIKMDEMNQKIKFHVRDYDDTLMIDGITYVKLSYNESLFKGVIEAIDNNIVTVQIPHLVKTLENRQFPREFFLPKDEKKIVLDIGQDIMDENPTRLTFTALDISLNGISIIVSENNFKLMTSFQHHVLVALGESDLKEKIILDLRYHQKFRYRLRGKVVVANRFGFMFLENLSLSAFDRFVH